MLSSNILCTNFLWGLWLKIIFYAKWVKLNQWNMETSWREKYQVNHVSTLFLTSKLIICHYYNSWGTIIMWVRAKHDVIAKGKIRILRSERSNKFGVSSQENLTLEMLSCLSNEARNVSRPLPPIPYISRLRPSPSI